MIPRAKLLSLAIAVPPFALKTDDVVAEARALFNGRHQDFDRMAPVFVNSGIRCRYSVRPYDWFRREQGWPERTEAFIEGATALFRKVSEKALAKAEVEACEIDTVITVSSTGIATPSIEARVMHEMGFRTDTSRIPVFGLGCAGGVTGLSLAARLAQARPGSKVLLCVIELCTLAFRPDELTKSNIVATAIFGDGAAACVLSTAGDSEWGAVEFAGEHTWPDTLDVMGWRMDRQGFGAIFARSIPDLVTSDLRPAVDRFLERNKLEVGQIDHFVFHPGGAKVVTALEQAFSFEQGSLVAEREVLADYGNMSAPTVLFVLDRAPPLSGRRFLSSLGPGFTASFATMVN
jgi:alkylresorcinol/alkylpyrone synthase